MDIIRACKDEEYRLSLTEEQRALLPDNPAGLSGMELSDDDLTNIVAGGGSKGGRGKSHTIVKACVLSTALFVDVCSG